MLTCTRPSGLGLKLQLGRRNPDGDALLGNSLGSLGNRCSSKQAQPDDDPSREESEQHKRRHHEQHDFARRGEAVGSLRRGRGRRGGGGGGGGGGEVGVVITADFHDSDASGDGGARLPSGRAPGNQTTRELVIRRCGTSSPLTTSQLGRRRAGAGTARVSRPSSAPSSTSSTTDRSDRSGRAGRSRSGDRRSSPSPG